MVENGIRGGICEAKLHYAEPNNVYMKHYDESKESLYLQYYDANSLYAWAMTQKLPVGAFKLKKNILKSTKDFIINYDENNDKGYFLEVDVKYPKNLHDLHGDLPFLPERMKINKCSKLVCNLYDKKNYVVHTKLLKQALNHGLILRKVHRVIQFKQEAWLKEYISGNIELRKEAENDFQRNFYKLLNNSVFGKTMDNVRKHRDIKLVTIDKRRNQLVSEPNYHTTKWFSENLLAIEMKKIKVKMNKPIYLGLAILDISKTLMYEFWYHYIKPKYGDNVKLGYMDTDSFIMHIKTEDSYKDIANDVEEKFDTSGYIVDRPLPIGKNIKELCKFKDELGGKIMTGFVELRPKTYSYLNDEGGVEKKAKGTKKYVTKRKIKFIDYKKAY